MEYKFLGNCGVKISNICLGTLTFGQNERPGQCNETESQKLLDRYVELGGNFIDTADTYSTGESEKIVGCWLKSQDRSRLIVATKVASKMSEEVNDMGLSRKHIIDSIERSLERLNTSYVDLYQTHVWDSGTPIEETFRTLADLVRAGKVHYIGVSNVCGWQLQKIVSLIQHMGLERVVTLQQQYSLLCRYPEWDEFEVCRNEKIGVLPWSPLKGGLLSGKFTRESVANPDTSTRVGWATSANRINQSHPNLADYANSEKFWTLMDVLKNIAQLQGKSCSQVAIKWLLQKEMVSSVIIGAKTLSQLEENMAAGNANWSLSLDEMQQLDAASQIDLPYPFELIDRLNTWNKRFR